jgi:hypothetical protein
MKKILLCNLFILSLSLSAQEDIQEILCSGITNNSALIELQIDLYSNENRIVIEEQAYNLTSNNAFKISWTNNDVEGIRYDNFLSKINGDMLVIAVNPENSESSIRANFNCVKKDNRVIE